MQHMMYAVHGGIPRCSATVRLVVCAIQLNGIELEGMSKRTHACKRDKKIISKNGQF